MLYRPAVPFPAGTALPRRRIEELMEHRVDFQNARGERLAGTLHAPEGDTKGGVVLGHCFTCTRHTGVLRDIAKALAAEGMYALRFDFSGNGQSEGAFVESTYSKQISEMKTAISMLKGYGPVRIGAAGHSLGAAVAVLTASRSEDIAAVCALAGRMSGLTPRDFLSREQQRELDQTGKVHFKSRGRALRLDDAFFADAGRFDLPAAIRSLSVPVMIIHGDRDEIVPVAEAHHAHRIKPDGVELTLVSGADHMFSAAGQRKETAGQVARWFAGHLLGRQTVDKAAERR
jgi:putative redox protein